MLNRIRIISAILLISVSCTNNIFAAGTIKGSAPSLAVDGDKVYMTFVNGDSILYSYSSDKGKSFSSPELVSVLDNLMSSGNRGPQIVSSKDLLIIAAPAASGNIYTYTKKKTEKTWKKNSRINDVPDVAKEGFVSLAANNDGQLFAIWLDLRNGNRNNIYGARSNDGGKTWLQNKLIYKSPDGAVCECCKPSVAMKAQQVVVMFRNNVNGNRDLYIIQSADGGANFGNEQKLGEGSWKLNGCPMDGGSVLITDDNAIQTAWRREENIYTNVPGKKEALVTAGRHVTIAAINNNNYIAYTLDGKIYCKTSGDKTIELGSGNSYPKLLAVNASAILCAWDYDKKIYTAVIQ